jgi:hypothetical protein
MFESLNRQWFALSEGNLFPLGDCGDIEAAFEIAEDTLEDVVWIIDYAGINKWIDVIKSVSMRLGIKDDM